MVDRPRVEITSRQQWRDWLAAHHADSAGIWLVTFKKGRGPHVAYTDVVQEALCFGWVDSLPRKLDEDRSMLMVTPRKRGSSWSGVNKRHVAELTELGLMTQAGLDAVARAQGDGTWTALDEVERLTEPDDLRAALDALPEARRHWDGFPPSTRRGILEWIGAAKTTATRDKRLRQTVGEAAVGRRANQWRQPGGTGRPS